MKGKAKKAKRVIKAPVAKKGRTKGRFLGDVLADLRVEKAVAAAKAEIAGPVDGGLISQADLCLLTGFSDSWHRKVAKKGYYPPPIKGFYQEKVTIAGLFKYQRELVELSKDRLNVKHEQLLDTKIAQADFDLKVSMHEYKATGEIATALMAVAEELKSGLSFALVDSLPALNAGLDASAQRKNNREVFVALCKRFREWAVQYDAKQQTISAAAVAADKQKETPC